MSKVESKGLPLVNNNLKNLKPFRGNKELPVLASELPKTEKVPRPLPQMFQKQNTEPASKSVPETEKGEVKSRTSEIQRVITDDYKPRYASKTDNLEEMSKCLERYNLPRLNQKTGTSPNALLP